MAACGDMHSYSPSMQRMLLAGNYFQLALQSSLIELILMANWVSPNLKNQMNLYPFQVYHRLYQLLVVLAIHYSCGRMVKYGSGFNQNGELGILGTKRINLHPRKSRRKWIKFREHHSMCVSSTGSYLWRKYKWREL